MHISKRLYCSKKLKCESGWGSENEPSLYEAGWRGFAQINRKKCVKAKNLQDPENRQFFTPDEVIVSRVYEAGTNYLYYFYIW